MILDEQFHRLRCITNVSTLQNPFYFLGNFHFSYRDGYRLKFFEDNLDAFFSNDAPLMRY